MTIAYPLVLPETEMDILQVIGKVPWYGVAFE